MGGVCCLPGAIGHWGSTQLGCGDTFTQAPEVQARPSTGPTTEVLPGDPSLLLALSSAPNGATGPFGVQSATEASRTQPSSLPGSSTLLLKVLDWSLQFVHDLSFPHLKNGPNPSSPAYRRGFSED